MRESEFAKLRTEDESNVGSVNIKIEEMALATSVALPHDHINIVRIISFPKFHIMKIRE